MKLITKFFTLFLFVILFGCNTTVDFPEPSCVDENFFSTHNSRSFDMGFTTWPFGPNLQDVDETYQFISDNATIYTEHIDTNIPWNAWIHNLPLPAEFTNEITSKVARKITKNKLLLSVSLLNMDRSDLAEDFDGSTPTYTTLYDQDIEDAYFKHMDYLVNAFQPDYLVIAIEANELLIHSQDKWDEYKILIQEVKARIKLKYPTLPISASITLHNLYQPDIANPITYTDEIINYANELDFVSISFYPFFKGQTTKSDFQATFDFLHSRITKPIAFVETAHIAENLSVSGLNLFIVGNECQQNAYLETLLTNAQEHNYEFVIWWAHQDFDALWETFPPELQDLGKIWRDTGILDESGNERLAYTTWNIAFNK